MPDRFAARDGADAEHAGQHHDGGARRVPRRRPTRERDAGDLLAGVHHRGQPRRGCRIDERYRLEGAISIALVPNAGGTPDGTYYKVIFKLNDGSTSEEYWAIPATTTTTIAAVRSKIVPSGVAMQVASRQYVDSSIWGALAGFHGPFPLVVTSFQRPHRKRGSGGQRLCLLATEEYSNMVTPANCWAGIWNLPPAQVSKSPADETKFIEQAKQAADFRDFGAIGNTIADDTSAANNGLAAVAKMAAPSSCPALAIPSG